ncbi:hypothetical protein J1N35_042914 [Gossypium stocksii]|uniref:Uncharacterized protein n=1 Tax=Gossypium stocksii TaxID=47602 RepID=A0A9D3ZEK2_9ROSI|nr:hypothetical protein J1N35_042914 [Gossypium stocksii]
MAPRKRVSQYPHLGIAIPPTILKNEAHFSGFAISTFQRGPQGSTLHKISRYPLLSITTLISSMGQN